MNYKSTFSCSDFSKSSVVADTKFLRPQCPWHTQTLNRNSFQLPSFLLAGKGGMLNCCSLGEP